MSEDLYRRVSKLEEQHDKMMDSIQQLLISTSSLNNTTQRLVEMIGELKAIEPRMRDVERDVQNNKLVVRALTWLGGIVGSSAVVLVMTYLSNLGG